jgi:hypothetical protein
MPQESTSNKRELIAQGRNAEVAIMLRTDPKAEAPGRNEACFLAKTEDF